SRRYTKCVLVHMADEARAVTSWRFDFENVWSNSFYGLMPVHLRVCAFLFFSHLTNTALRADSLLASAVMRSARATPPIFPPFAPCFLKKAITSGGRFIFDIAKLYVTPSGSARAITVDKKGAARRQRPKLVAEFCFTPRRPEPSQR